MMTKIAHIRENRKNNKGFSLVELIIVIAIMVALIAVMGPQYVKYIQKSRDSALASAAEDLEAWCKTAVADEDTQLDTTNSTNVATIVITSAGGTLNVTVSNLSTKSGAVADGKALGDMAGFTQGQSMGKSSNVYTITLTHAATGATVTMSKSTAA